MKITEVVAALITDGRKFLICRRPPDKARGLLWEFVGGKLEPGESGREALVRECMEELGVAVSAGGQFMEVVHEYPDLTVRLTVFWASISSGEPKALEHSEIKWITPEEIDEYEFCAADGEILEKIKNVFGGEGELKEPAREDAAAEKKKKLFLDQKELLDTFLSTGALSPEQYKKSLDGLRTKMGIDG